MWEQILRKEVDSNGLAVVSKKLGYSRTALSLVLSGKYGGKTDRVAEKVMQVYSQVLCPFKGEVIVMELCRTTALGRAPMHNPAKMSQWRACQSCVNKPKGERNE